MSHATLLGALMLDNDAFPDVAKIVGAADFTSASAPLDAVTVCERLRASGALARAGGTEALAALVDQAPGAHSALRLAREMLRQPNART